MLRIVRVAMMGCLLLTLASLTSAAYGQIDSTELADIRARKAEREKIVPLSFKERLALKVNTVDWALVVANVGFEYDLSSSPFNRWTLGATIRYTGGAVVSFNPRLDVKLLDVRAEARRYWHQGLTMKSGKKRKPKFWRGYYWGVYAGYSDYTMFFPNGYTGENINAGGCLGYEVSLLSFKKGCLDLDLGLNAGWMFGNYEKSKLVDDERVMVKSKDWHVTPYPVVSEIRVGLVYRFQSIKEKYVKSKK